MLGNEIADVWAVEAATREERSRKSRGIGGRTKGGAVSMTFVKAMIKRKAVTEWRQEIIEKS